MLIKEIKSEKNILSKEKSNNFSGPFVDILDYTKTWVTKIKDFQIFLDIDSKKIESEKVKHIFLDFIKTSFKIQEKYSKNIWILKKESKWDEADPVTEADKKIESILREKFSKFIPEYSIAWEEDEINIKDESKILLLDPIDWTSWFLKWIAKYGTVLWMYRNWYNILSIVLNTKARKVYFSDLNEFWVYNIKVINWKIELVRDKKNILDLTEKDKIFLHLNFKWKNVDKNEEIKNKLEDKLKVFNKENESNYLICFKETSVDTWVKVWRGEIWGFIHYWPAPHDISWNLIYKIHNNELNFTNHNWKNYNYFDHNDLINSYKEYNNKKDTDWKKYLYKYPIVMTTDKKLHSFILECLEEFSDIFDEKENPIN